MALGKPVGRRWTCHERTSFGVGYARKTGRVPLEQALKLAIGYALRRRGGYAGHCCGSLVMPGRSRTADREGQRLAGVTGWREGMAGVHQVHRFQSDGFTAGRSRRRYAAGPGRYRTNKQLNRMPRVRVIFFWKGSEPTWLRVQARLSSWLLGCSTRLRSDHHAAVRFPA